MIEKFGARFQRSVVVLTACLCACGVVSAADAPPVKWTLSAAKPSSERGKMIAQLKADIAPGWHLYAMQQEAAGPRPLRISLPTDLGLELDPVRPPEPIVEHDANFDAPTRYYETSVSFELSFAKLSSARASRLSSNKLFAEVRYQACNQEHCLPPTTTRVEATTK